jgi:hypothetical protein
VGAAEAALEITSSTGRAGAFYDFGSRRFVEHQQS